MTVLLLAILTALAGFLLYVHLDARQQAAGDVVHEDLCCCGCGRPLGRVASAHAVAAQARADGANKAPAAPYFCSLPCARLQSGQASFPLLLLALMCFAGASFCIISGIGIPY